MTRHERVDGRKILKICRWKFPLKNRFYRFPRVDDDQMQPSCGQSGAPYVAGIYGGGATSMELAPQNAKKLGSNLGAVLEQTANSILFQLGYTFERMWTSKC